MLTNALTNNYSQCNEAQPWGKNFGKICFPRKYNRKQTGRKLIKNTLRIKI